MCRPPSGTPATRSKCATCGLRIDCSAVISAVDHVGGPAQRVRVADDLAHVEVDRRAHGRAAEGELAEFNGAQTPERFGEPEIAVLRKRHLLKKGRRPIGLRLWVD